MTRPPRSHKTIFPQNSRNTQKRLAEKKNLCTSVKSVGGSSPPEASVYSVKSVEEYPPPETSVNSVNSVGGLAQANLEWVLWKEFGGRRGYGKDPYPPTKTPTDCTDVHRLGGYGIPAIPTQPQNYLPTEFTEHTETTGGEEKSVHICEICGRLLSARRFCGVCVFRGRFLSEAMLVQRRPLHPLNITTLQQQGCHATTTRLPRYNNKVATLRQQGCHATAKCRETE